MGNVNDASKNLPIGTRTIFLEIWNELEIMDLYDGDLRVYLQIIKQQIASKKRKIKDLKLINEQATKILKSTN